MPGPYVRSHRRPSSARAARSSIAGSSPIQSSIGAHRYWLEIHDPERAAAGDVALRRQQEQHAASTRRSCPRSACRPPPCSWSARSGTSLVRPLAGSGPLAPQRGERLGVDPRDPGVDVVRDTGLGEQRHELAPLARHQRPGARRVHHRRQVERDDEHRAAHGQHPQQRAALVEGVLEVGDRERVEAGAQRQHDGRRVATSAARRGRRRPARPSPPARRGGGGPAAAAGARRGRCGARQWAWA